MPVATHSEAARVWTSSARGFAGSGTVVIQGNRRGARGSGRWTVGSLRHRAAHKEQSHGRARFARKLTSGSEPDTARHCSGCLLAPEWLRGGCGKQKRGRRWLLLSNVARRRWLGTRSEAGDFCLDRRDSVSCRSLRDNQRAQTLPPGWLMNAPSGPASPAVGSQLRP